jgi:hypothetical protein
MTDITPAAAPFHVILDANVWVSERLLQTTIGSALLYAVSAARATIVVPEIVELEVNNVLPEQAETANEDIRKRIGLLKHLSGSPFMTFLAPSRSAVQAGIQTRWEQLNGVITRTAFTHQHARGALNRILGKHPPCGQNNEQFRDCCIWEAALEVARNGPAHLITNDSAFYENRDRARGLAPLLRTELSDHGLCINLYPDIAHFLSGMGETIFKLDETTVAAKILTAVIPAVTGIIECLNASQKNLFILGKPSTPRIQGFSTPKSAIFAVTFELNFPLENTVPERSDATLTVEGTCSYDAQNNDDLSEIEIVSWSTRIKGFETMWRGEGWQEPGRLERYYSNARVIR